MTDPSPFDVCGPLPTGTVVLEASAGTGKTFTIAALAARYVAEGVARLDQLMLVTFGRMASNELRLRVRDRLVALERALATGVPDDEVAELLLQTDEAERAVRHRRLVRALADFDAAIWPDRQVTLKTRNQAITRTRAWLGSDDDGVSWLRPICDGALRLSEEVLVDWELFRGLQRRASESGRHPAAVRRDLGTAMRLVRGRPLSRREVVVEFFDRPIRGAREQLARMRSRRQGGDK